MLGVKVPGSVFTNTKQMLKPCLHLHVNMMTRSVQMLIRQLMTRTSLKVKGLQRLYIVVKSREINWIIKVLGWLRFVAAGGACVTEVRTI